MTSLFISIWTHFIPISLSQTQLGRNQPQFCLFKARTKLPSAAILYQNIRGKQRNFLSTLGVGIRKAMSKEAAATAVITLWIKCPSSKFTISISNSKCYRWADLAFRTKGKSLIKFNRMRVRGVYQLPKASVNKFRITFHDSFHVLYSVKYLPAFPHVKHSFSWNLLYIPSLFFPLISTSCLKL